LPVDQISPGCDGMTFSTRQRKLVAAHRAPALVHDQLNDKVIA
jgi:hypothetical protein